METTEIHAVRLSYPHNYMNYLPIWVVITRNKPHTPKNLPHDGEG